MTESTLVLEIEGMTCEGCAETVKRYLKQVEGVKDTHVDWEEGRGEVVFDPATTTEEKILNSRAFQRQYRAGR